MCLPLNCSTGNFSAAVLREFAKRSLASVFTLARERSKCITVGATFFSVRSELAIAAQLAILVFYVKKPLFMCRISRENPNIENSYIRFFFEKKCVLKLHFFRGPIS